MVLAGEHYPKERFTYVIPEPPYCQCPPNANLCTKRILEAAFKQYTKCYPERFPFV